MRQTSRRCVVVAVLALAFLGLTRSTEARQGQTVDPALKKAADDRVAVRLAGDAKKWAAYVLDDAYIVGPGGVIATKQQRFSQIPAEKVSFKVSEERYRMFGDTAIHGYRTDGPNAQGQQQAQRYIEVWVKQSGEWKVAGIQVTNIAKP